MFSAIPYSVIPEWLRRGSIDNIWISDETFGNDETLRPLPNHNPLFNAIAQSLEISIRKY